MSRCEGRVKLWESAPQCRGRGAGWEGDAASSILGLGSLVRER